MLKVGDTLAPAAIVIDAGTITEGSLLAIDTVMSLTAAALRMTRLFAGPATPPTTVTGDRMIEEMPTGITVKAAVFVTFW